MKELGSKIKELRISLGLSQQQFAESLGYTHKSMINKIELGKCDMSYDKILRLLKEYNLNASEFLDEEEIKINHDKIENLMLPDANRIFPLKSGLKSVIHIKPTIKNKNIIVGEYSYYSGNNFESCVTHLYDFINDTGFNIQFKKNKNRFHDRYIVIDYNIENEIIFHCGASSKDAGKRITTITRIEEQNLYKDLIKKILNNDDLIF